MDHQTNVATAKRRTREEIRQIVAEFATSGMQQSEFCGSRGISRSSLDRHLSKQSVQDQGSGCERQFSDRIVGRELVCYHGFTANQWALNSAVECHLHTSFLSNTFNN